jgi:hypothetical protein
VFDPDLSSLLEFHNTRDGGRKAIRAACRSF